MNYQTNLQNVENAISQFNHQVLTDLDRLFEDFSNATMDIFSSPTINADIALLKQMVEADIDDNDIQYVFHRERTSERIKLRIGQNPYVFAFRLYINETLVTVDSFLNTVAEVNDPFKERGWLDRTIAAEGRQVITEVYEQIYLINHVPFQVRLISVSRNISDISVPHTRVPLGVLALDVDIEAFNSILLNHQSVTQNASAVIFNQYGEQVASNTNGEAALYPKSDYLVFSHTSPFSEYTIYSYVPKQDLNITAYSVLIYFVQIITLFFILCVVVSFFFSSYLSKPLKILSNIMKRVGSGSLTERVPQLREPELQAIGCQFNLMLDDVQRLIDINYRLQVKEKETQLLALQSQINPHFLYNTLETINWKMRTVNDTAEAEDASNMNIALGEILRYSFRGSQQLVPLSEDIEQVYNYLFIQKNRFSDYFKAYIFTDDESEKCMIPKLLIQPLVENSIIHGFVNKQSGGVLVVKSVVRDGFLVVTVYDNGCGLPEDFSIQNSEGKGSFSIGLQNVNDRLVLRYGPDYCLKFKTAPGKFTKFIITIPQSNNFEDG